MYNTTNLSLPLKLTAALKHNFFSLENYVLKEPDISVSRNIKLEDYH